MENLQKVKSNPYICAIELDFNGELSPQHTISAQNFYNATENGNFWKDTYFGKKTVRFSENTKLTKAGNVFTQNLRITFPSNDTQRANRLQLFKFVKYIKLILNNNTSLVLGRNDYFQNTKPKVKIESNLQLSTISFTTESIFPTAFVNEDTTDPAIYQNDLLPHDIPITFINL